MIWLLFEWQTENANLVTTTSNLFENISSLLPAAIGERLKKYWGSGRGP